VSFGAPKLRVMTKSIDISWQPTLFGSEEWDIDAAFSKLKRVHLDDESWVDHQAAWVAGSDMLFDEILRARDWGQRTRRMYDKRVREPRLTASWNRASGEPLEPEILERMRIVLSDKYGVEFDSVGFNLYRDGNDSVAWHGDRIKKEVEDPIVALVSLGDPRRFLLRPKDGTSTTFMLGRGDLLVTGGKTQRTWQHSVPKVAKAGPRISLAFRHGMDPRAYTGKRTEDPSG
jgi:alkylated DNA repair dioxygenase AlkB